MRMHVKIKMHESTGWDESTMHGRFGLATRRTKNLNSRCVQQEQEGKKREKNNLESRFEITNWNKREKCNKRQSHAWKRRRLSVTWINADDPFIIREGEVVFQRRRSGRPRGNRCGLPRGRKKNSFLIARGRNTLLSLIIAFALRCTREEGRKNSCFLINNSFRASDTVKRKHFSIESEGRISYRVPSGRKDKLQGSIRRKWKGSIRRKWKGWVLRGWLFFALPICRRVEAALPPWRAHSRIG